jgi:curved DNA-binding protein CbpA
MKAIHPDRQRPERRTAAEEQAKRLNAAYAVLANPVQRQAYDRTIRSAHVQDQLMSRYVGGFYPAAGGDADLFGAPMRRHPTTAERREQAAADRNAVMTIVVVFGGFTLALLVGLVLWGVLTSLLRRRSSRDRRCSAGRRGGTYPATRGVPQCGQTISSWRIGFPQAAQVGASSDADGAEASNDRL